MSDRPTTSRLSGFYRASVPARVAQLSEAARLEPSTVAYLRSGGGMTVADADCMSENVLAVFGLPLAVGLNFRVNGRDVLLPMAVEEPSVVAAASNAARLVRVSGGFDGEATKPVMTAQVHLDEVTDAAGAGARLASHEAEIAALADAAIPRMVERGGGFREVEARILDAAEGLVCIHLYINVGDAMGANMVDAVAEAVAPRLAEIIGGRVGLRILSNLPLRRLVRVRAEVGDEALGGLGDAVVRASRFAEKDPFRAVTHNKGILNGVDAVAVALGQDWRSIEAGAHGYAALSARGPYRPLAVWRRTEAGIRGELEMPLAVGTVGGSTRAHPGIRAAFDLLRPRDAGEMAVICGAAGLATNLAALRALAGEGIQRGHMKLHARKAQAPGVTPAPATKES